VSQPTEAQVRAATAYESLFVQALFQQWAPRVASAARVTRGQRVLDVACGTGILAREVLKLAGDSGRVTGIDPSPGMLAVARQLAPSAQWHQGVAEDLPFENASFDVVVSQFGLMFFSDRLQALNEMLRVLKPGGRLAVAVWDALENIPAYASLVELLENTAGRRAADALRAPFVLGHRDDLAALFAAARIADPDIVTHAGTAHFPSLRVMVEAELRGWLPIVGIVLDEEQIEGILSDAETALASYAAADGRVAFPLSAHIVAAGKPGSAHGKPEPSA